jgi:hypothetical protein
MIKSVDRTGSGQLLRNTTHVLELSWTFSIESFMCNKICWCSWFQGYDMEDAMIINKASYERGFAHGCVYKTEFFELKSVSYNVNRSCQVVSILDK